MHPMTPTGGPRGYAPPLPVHIKLNISETVQIPTPKPYILEAVIDTYHGSPGGMPHPISETIQTLTTRTVLK